MSELRANRVARLHQQFLCAADTYPYLYFAAATERHCLSEWPETVGNSPGDVYLGLTPRDWKDALGITTDIVNCWLQMEGRLWQGAFFVNRSLWKSDSRFAQHDPLASALEEFMRLSSSAAGHFGSARKVPQLVE
jgi:hypothetical protein